MDDECVPAFVPGSDPPGTLYGFSRAEWQAAADRFPAVLGEPMAHWDQMTDLALAGHLPGLAFEELLALARTVPGAARRIVARFAWSADKLPDSAATVAKWCAKSAAEGSPVPDYVAETWLEELDRHLRTVREIVRCAEEPG